MLATWTMVPPPCARMMGTIARVVRRRWFRIAAE
jgi:hypothetical protein